MYTEEQVRQDLRELKTLIANCEMYNTLICKYEMQLDMNQGNRDLLLEKIERFNKEIKSYIDSATDKASLYTKNIFKLKPIHQRALIETYINNKSIVAVGIEMHYSVDWVRRLLKAATRQLTDYMNEA